MPRAEMRIRIRRDAATRLGYRFNWSEFGEPSLTNFKQCLTDAQRRLNSVYTWRSWTIPQAATWYMEEQHYTCQQMADLLGRATLLDRASEVGTCAILGENFSRHANPFDSAYLNLGASMFKLQPVAIADVTQPLRMMRERVQQETQMARNEILAAAGREAAIVTNAAEETRARVGQELEEAQRDRNIGLPAWMRHADYLPVMLRDNYAFPIEIGMRLDFIIEVFFFTYSGEAIYEWDATSSTRIRSLIWMQMHPITGRYNLEAARLDASYQGELPHMSHGGACLGPTGLPESIRNQDDLFRLRDAIGRCYTRVNMNSLLCPVRDWSREVQQTAPEAVLTFWNESNHGRNIPMDAGETDPAYFHADRVVAVTEERRATWDLGRLGEAMGRVAGETVIRPDEDRRPDGTPLEHLERLRRDHNGESLRHINFHGALQARPEERLERTVPPLTPERVATIDETLTNVAEGEEEGEDGTV